MDVEMFKLLLSTQDQAYRGALEIMMKQIHEEVGSLRSTVDDLRKSLEFTQGEVDNLRTEVKKLEKEKAADKTIIQDLRKQCHTANENCEILEDRCDYLEDYSRRNNVHITGMEERPGGETWEQTAEHVQNMLADKMQLPDIILERAHRVGQRSEQRARPVVARFLRFSDRELVMRNAKKLKGTNIFINDDLCPASQEKRRLQLPQLQQARREGKIAYFRHTKLVIRERGDGSGGRGQVFTSQGPVASGRRLTPEETGSNPSGDTVSEPDIDSTLATNTAAAATSSAVSVATYSAVVTTDPASGGMGKTRDTGKMTLRSSK